MDLTTTEIAELRIETDRLAMKGLSSGKLELLLNAYEDLSAAQDRIQELEEQASNAEDLETEAKDLRKENSAMRMMLEDIQFSATGGTCPTCAEPHNHKKTCSLEALLP